MLMNLIAIHKAAMRKGGWVFSASIDPIVFALKRHSSSRSSHFYNL